MGKCCFKNLTAQAAIEYAYRKNFEDKINQQKHQDMSKK